MATLYEIESAIYDCIDSETGETKAESEVSGKTVKARKLQSFPLGHVKNTLGRKYTVRLTETGSDETNGIAFYYQPESEESDTFRANGESRDGVMVMKTVTRRFDTESFIVMLISVWFIWGFLWFLSRLFK